MREIVHLQTGQVRLYRQVYSVVEIFLTRYNCSTVR